jgi:hypothetical protein
MDLCGRPGRARYKMWTALPCLGRSPSTPTNRASRPPSTDRASAVSDSVGSARADAGGLTSGGVAEADEDPHSRHAYFSIQQGRHQEISW